MRYLIFVCFIAFILSGCKSAQKKQESSEKSLVSEKGLIFKDLEFLFAVPDGPQMCWYKSVVSKSKAEKMQDELQGDNDAFQRKIFLSSKAINEYFVSASAIQEQLNNTTGYDGIISYLQDIFYTMKDMTDSQESLAQQKVGSTISGVGGAGVVMGLALVAGGAVGLMGAPITCLVVGGTVLVASGITLGGFGLYYVISSKDSNMFPPESLVTLPSENTGCVGIPVDIDLKVNHAIQSSVRAAKPTPGDEIRCPFPEHVLNGSWTAREQ